MCIRDSTYTCKNNVKIHNVHLTYESLMMFFIIIVFYIYSTYSSMYYFIDLLLLNVPQIYLIFLNSTIKIYIQFYYSLSSKLHYVFLVKITFFSTHYLFVSPVYIVWVVQLHGRISKLKLSLIHICKYFKILNTCNFNI